MHYGDKLQLKKDAIKLMGEVTAYFPASQTSSLNIKGQCYFGISINGHDTFISEPFLEILFEKYVPEVKLEQPTIKPVAKKENVKPIKKIVQKTKKKSKGEK